MDCNLLRLWNFSKTAGPIKSAKSKIYYNRKNSKLRMDDDNQVIKTSGNNLEFFRGHEVFKY